MSEHTHTHTGDQWHNGGVLMDQPNQSGGPTSPGRGGVVMLRRGALELDLEVVTTTNELTNRGLSQSAGDSCRPVESVVQPWREEEGGSVGPS